MSNSGRTLNRCWLRILCLLVFSPLGSGQQFQSTFSLSTPGSRFIPVDEGAQLLSATWVKSLVACTKACNTLNQCHTFDFAVNQPNECRLFEGDINTFGSIGSSASPTSRVGTIKRSPRLYASYNQSCSVGCTQDRYLVCGPNLTCQCTPHTYWDSSVSMCLPQSPVLGWSCESNPDVCRMDRNLTCLQFYQCGRKWIPIPDICTQEQ